MSEAKKVINELLVEVFNHILSIEGSKLKERGIKISMNEMHVLEAVKKTKVENTAVSSGEVFTACTNLTTESITPLPTKIIRGRIIKIRLVFLNVMIVLVDCRLF